MAKGQKRSTREIKKPKKTAAERLKASTAASSSRILRTDDKDPPKKS